MKNLRKITSANYVVPVPVGLHISIQYSEAGVLEKVYVKKDSKLYEDPQLLDIFCNGIVPSKLSLSNSTTWIDGVLYTDKPILCCGKVGKDDIEDRISYALKEPDNHNFFAYNITNTGFDIVGHATINRWLLSNKFHILKGFFGNTSPNLMLTTINSCLSNFKLLTPFMFNLYENGANKIVINDLYLHKVIALTRYNDEYGNIMCKLTLEDDSCLYYPYYQVANINVGKYSYILIDDLHSIIKVYESKSTLSKQLNCIVCGRPISYQSNMKCSDIHCMSNRYSNLCHMLRSFDLPELEYGKYLTLVNNNELITDTDVFLLPEYKDIKLNVSLPKFIRGCIPYLDLPSDRVITEFCQFINYDLTMLIKYINKPKNIISHFTFSDNRDANKLVNWLLDMYNANTLQTLYESDQFEIIDNVCSSSTPYLHDKLIYLTGKFRCQKHELKQNILDYSGKLASRFTNDVDIIVVGNILEDVNSYAINKAQELSKLIYTEDQFINKYFNE